MLVVNYNLDFFLCVVHNLHLYSLSLAKTARVHFKPYYTERPSVLGLDLILGVNE